MKVTKKRYRVERLYALYFGNKCIKNGSIGTRGTNKNIIGRIEKYYYPL